MSCSECGWPILIKGSPENNELICPSCGMGVVFHNLKIDERLFELLKRRAREERVSIDELTGSAIEEYIEECERGRRLARQDF